MKPSWNPPPHPLLLSKQDVHIWRAALDLPSKSVQALKGDLSMDERMRAEHFAFERDRSQFIAGRGILRLILAYYLGVEPGAIRFCYEKNGKPRLQPEFAGTGIQFNLSHSEGLALYAFSCGREVGIDLEFMREIPEIEYFVEQFFSESERISFNRLPQNEKQEAFYRWWTRKEALGKAVGEGLSHPSDWLVGESLIAPSDRTIKRFCWSLMDLSPFHEFAAAVAVEEGGLYVQDWQFEIGNGWANCDGAVSDLKHYPLFMCGKLPTPHSLTCRLPINESIFSKEDGK